MKYFSIMKKVMLIIVVALVFVSLLTGCGSMIPECEHYYTSTITKEATYDSDGEMKYVCEKCGDTYTEIIEKLERHVVSTSILDDTLSNIKYSNGVFSISLGKLVNRAMDGYKIQYLTGEEAIAQGYLSQSQVDDSVDINYLYYAIISGDTMQNPDIPYLTTFEKEAVKAWMLFDENDQLLNSNVTLCGNLAICATLIMTSGY